MKKIKVINIVAISLAFAMISSCTSTNVSAPAAEQEEVVEVEPELEVEEMLKAAKEDVELEEIELKESLETKRQIDKFVDEKPEAVASLLRNWLSDEDWE